MEIKKKMMNGRNWGLRNSKRRRREKTVRGLERGRGVMIEEKNNTTFENEKTKKNETVAV